MVASVTMVRGLPSAPRPSGVACVSTMLPAPSPSVMIMTIVLASGHENSARTGTPQVRLSRNVTSTTRCSSSLEPSSTTRWLNEYGWNQAPCQGSSRLAMTSSGSQIPGAVITAAIDPASGGRRGSVGRSVGTSSVDREPDPEQHSVVPGAERPPGPVAARFERQSVPAAVQGVADDRAVIEKRTQMRAGTGPGDEPPVGRAPEHDLPAGDRARDRGACRRRRSLAPATNQPPGLRFCETVSDAAMRPGRASCQVGVMRSVPGWGRRAIGIREASAEGLVRVLSDIADPRPSLSAAVR